MRGFTQLTILKDAEGYEVATFGTTPSRGRTVLGERHGVRVVGRGGPRQLVTYCASQQNELWKKARGIETPDALAEFMSEWGPITRWDMSWPFDEPFNLLQPVLHGLRELAKYVDSFNRKAFFERVSRHRFLELRIDHAGNYHPRVNTMSQFMVYEMEQALGGERAARAQVIECPECGRPFLIGARRSRGSRRRDSLYCSPRCRKSSHSRSGQVS